MVKPPRERNQTVAGGADPCAGQAAGKSSAVPVSSKAATARRGRDPAVRALAREHAAAAVAALAAVMNDPAATPAARVPAASALLNWGYGKPGPGPADGTATGGRGVTEQVIRLVWGGEANS